MASEIEFLIYINEATILTLRTERTGEIMLHWARKLFTNSPELIHTLVVPGVHYQYSFPNSIGSINEVGVGRACCALQGELCRFHVHDSA